MADRDYHNKVAIVGFNTTKAMRHSEHTVGELAIEASREAVRDAGLKVSDLDGIACGTLLPMWNRAATLQRGVEMVDHAFLTQHLDLSPNWALNLGSLPEVLVHAASAVATGEANYVLVNRTLHNPASGYNRFTSNTASGQEQWTAPYGNSAPTFGFALIYQEYQRRYGARREHMAGIVSELRRNVQKIPEAYWYGSPLTVEDYMEGRMVADPMCIFDSDIPVDGSGSFVLTTAERAADLPNRPVYITDWAQQNTARVRAPGTLGVLADHQEGGAQLCERLWKSSGWSAADAQVIQLYDGFTPLIYIWMEALGLCGEGEAWSCLKDGLIDPTSGRPLLSGGGAAGWGRMHGIPQVAECYLQLAKHAGDRQLAQADTALACYALPGARDGMVILFSADQSS
jgi:acetyl-CoA acetyltransferase